MLGPMERYLVTYDFIFNRVSERGIQDHLDLVASHKSHLNYSFTEASVTVDLDDNRTFPRLQFR